MNDYLIHHGILGQKWGVRRYQNEDGSLTTAGKSRYSVEQSNRDKAVYGRFAEKRIARKVNSGASVSEARASEADRINRFRTAANNVKRQEVTNTTAIAGAVIGGALSRPAMKAVKGFVNALAWSDNPIGRFLGAHNGTINRGIDFMNEHHLTEILGAGVGGLTGKMLPHQVSSGVMISGGYSPSKRR